MDFGTSTWGHDGQFLEKVHRPAFACSSTSTLGRSRTASFLLRGFPEANSSFLALSRWSHQIWKTGVGMQGAGLSLPELTRSFEIVQQSAPSPWAEVRGPIGSVLMEVACSGSHLEKCLQGQAPRPGVHRLLDPFACFSGGQDRATISTAAVQSPRRSFLLGGRWRWGQSWGF